LPTPFPENIVFQDKALERAVGGKMSAITKGALHVALAFILGWAPLALAWSGGARSFTEAGAASLIFLLSPALAAILCALWLDKGSPVDALGVRPRLNGWWLAGLLAPALLAPIAIGATLAFSPYSYVGFAHAAGQAQAAPGLLADGRPLGLAGLLAVSLASFALFAIPEELGWRGYLYAQWRGLGFWPSSWAIGFAWGAWHWPAMVFFGLNLSPGHLLPSVVLFTLVTLLLSPLMTLMRDRGRSIWPPVIFHASFNAVVPLALSLWNAPDFPWGKIALTAVPALGALLVALFYRRPDRELPATTS
jgi:uncharacterized protein